MSCIIFLIVLCEVLLLMSSMIIHRVLSIVRNRILILRVLHQEIEMWIVSPAMLMVPTVVISIVRILLIIVVVVGIIVTIPVITVVVICAIAVIVLSSSFGLRSRLWLRLSLLPLSTTSLLWRRSHSWSCGWSWSWSSWPFLLRCRLLRSRLVCGSPTSLASLASMTSLTFLLALSSPLTLASYRLCGMTTKIRRKFEFHVNITTIEVVRSAELKTNVLIHVKVNIIL